MVRRAVAMFLSVVDSIYVIKIALSVCLSVCLAWTLFWTLRVTWGRKSYASPLALCVTRGQMGKKSFFAFLCVSEYFESIETHLVFFSKIFVNFALRAKRVMRQKGKKFFFAFLRVSEHFESIETHFFLRKFS